MLDVGGSEEIAFVGGVDEHVTAKDFAVGGSEGEDAVILFEDGEGFVEGG